MTKKIIAIDIDDVVADTTNALRRLVNKQFKFNLSRKDYLVEGEYWGYYERIWKSHKVDHLVSFETLHDQMASDQSGVGVVQGAKSAILELKEKYELIAVTSRRVQWVDATHEWLDSSFPGAFKDVVFVHHDNNDGRTKGDACVDIGASWLIDDNLEHCQTALDKEVTPLLFGEYGWSKNREVPQGIFKVKNWQEVSEYFENEI